MKKFKTIKEAQEQLYLEYESLLKTVPEDNLITSENNLTYYQNTSVKVILKDGKELLFKNSFYKVFDNTIDIYQKITMYDIEQNNNWFSNYFYIKEKISNIAYVSIPIKNILYIKLDHHWREY